MRVDGWEEHLDAAIEAARARPFELGGHDCCRFAASCVDAITGSDLVGELGRHYADDSTARRFLAARGGMRAAVTSFLGEPRDGWTRARRGDVCLVPTEGMDGVGICVGPYIAVAAERGLSLYPISAALAVWVIE